MPEHNNDPPTLSPAQRAALHAILAQAFDPGALRRLLANQWGVDYDRLVPADANLNDAVQAIIAFVEKARQPQALIQAALAERPDVVQALVDTLPAGLIDAPVDLPALIAAARTYRTLPPGGEVEPDWDALLRPYLATVARRSARLMLAPLDQSGQQRAHMQLAQLFISLDAGPADVALREDADRRGRYTAIVGHIHQQPRLILLGDPGSGKTTVLRFVAHCLAQHALHPNAGWLQRLRWAVIGTVDREPDEDATPLEMRDWVHRVVPVYVELRNLDRAWLATGEPLALWHALCARLEQDGLAAAIPALQRQAQQGQLLFLFDGVDELPAELRPAAWRAIDAHHHSVQGGNRWVATCRILSFDQTELPELGIPLQTVRPLTPSQVAAFVAGWFGTLAAAGDMSPPDAEARTRQLQAAAREDALRELADNPMLLTIMALVQTFYATLPRERAKLYQACVETLLLRWQQAKETDNEAALPDLLTQLGVQQNELERLLWEIGWKAHRGSLERGERADIPEAEVMALAAEHLGSYAKAERFVDYTEKRAHLLIGRGGKRRSERSFAFPHRTFQEYLAACRLASQRRFGLRARELAEAGDMWREVLALAVGTLVFNQNNREKALDGIRDVALLNTPQPNDAAGWRRVWLAAEMLAVIGREQVARDEVGREVLPHVRALLTTLVTTGRLTPQQRLAAGDALALLGDERPGVGAALVDGVRLPDIRRGGAVPPGTYMIGDTKPQFSDEKLRDVIIDRAFSLAQYPVTVAQFDCFVEAGDVDDERWWADMPDDERFRHRIAEARWTVANRPRENVTWYQAVAFCRWLDHHLRQAGIINRDELVTLPHEHEWEAAARYAGNGKCDRRLYPWGGDAIDAEHANYAATGLSETSAVGLFPAGRQAELGLYDLSGNVWEWCSNKYDRPGDDAVDKSGATRTLRGGSWDFTSGPARAASRNVDLPAGRSVYGGFRVCVRRPPSHDH